MHITDAQVQKTASWPKDAAVGFIASILIALSSYLTIPLPFSPVPLSILPHMMLFIPAMMSPRAVAFAMGSYMIQGLIGFPVFAGGASGILTLVGPRGGYIVGYVASALLVSYLQQKAKSKDFFTCLRHVALGNGLLYLLGYSWLSVFLGYKMALLAGIAPFLIGDGLKTILVAKCLSTKRLRHLSASL